MNKRTTALVLAVSATLVAGTAWAITNGGVPDDGQHPYVGLAVFDDADGRPMWRCSGTLLSPTLFLTAGHCTFGAAGATIWFEEDVQGGIPGNGYPIGGPTSVDGTPYTHPQYVDAAFFLYDLGVVVLDEPVKMDTYGRLPALGELDVLRTRRGLQDQTFTAVGYGLQEIKPVWQVGQRVRLRANPRLLNLDGTVGIPAGTAALFSNNPGRANTGGTCFGDSGGPIFLGDTNLVATVTSFGMNGNCEGTGGGYRVDQADDLNWLYGTFGDQIP